MLSAKQYNQLAKHAVECRHFIRFCHYGSSGNFSRTWQSGIVRGLILNKIGIWISGKSAGSWPKITVGEQNAFDGLEKRLSESALMTRAGMSIHSPQFARNPAQARRIFGSDRRKNQDRELVPQGNRARGIRPSSWMCLFGELHPSVCRRNRLQRRTDPRRVPGTNAGARRESDNLSA